MFLRPSHFHQRTAITVVLGDPEQKQLFGGGERMGRERKMTYFRSLSMPAGFRRHLVGKTLRNVCNRDVT